MYNVFGYPKYPFEACEIYHLISWSGFLMLYQYNKTMDIEYIDILHSNSTGLTFFLASIIDSEMNEDHVIHFQEIPKDGGEPEIIGIAAVRLPPSIEDFERTLERKCNVESEFGEMLKKLLENEEAKEGMKKLYFQIRENVVEILFLEDLTESEMDRFKMPLIDILIEKYKLPIKELLDENSGGFVMHNAK